MISTTPTFDVSNLVDQHKSVMTGGGSVIKHCTSFFDAQASVAYIPTGVVATGPIQIEALLGEFAKQAHGIQNEQVLSRTVSANQVVEETLLTLVHKDSISWLLPGVRPTGKEINVALVTVMEFTQDGKIINKRIYWDQASVLRQIGVLPKSLYCRSNSSEVILPIVGSEVASRFYSGVDQVVEKMEQVEVASEASVTSEQANKRLNPKRNESDNIFSSEPVAFRPSSRVLNRPGGTPSDIFGLGPSEPHVFQKAQIPAPGGAALNIFDDAPVVVAADASRRDPNQTNSQEIQQRFSRHYSGEGNKSQFSIGQSDETASSATPEVHTGRRQLSQSVQSSFSFSDGSEESATVHPARSGRRDPNAQSQEAVQRPSSRVLSRPGGKQNFTFA